MSQPFVSLDQAALWSVTLTPPGGQAWYTQILSGESADKILRGLFGDYVLVPTDDGSGTLHAVAGSRSVLGIGYPLADLVPYAGGGGGEGVDIDEDDERILNQMWDEIAAAGGVDAWRRQQKRK